MDDASAGIDALAAGASVLVGRYTFDGRTWSWSDDLFRLHGFEPGAVVPTSELMVAHQDRLDVDESRDAFKQALTSGESFASYHHLIDAKKRRRTVLVAGQGSLDEHGRVVYLRGYMVDLTEVSAMERRAEADSAIAGVTRYRAVIEQAKGIVMLALAVTADEAFAVLRGLSQDNNVKVHDLAANLVDFVCADRSLPDEAARTKVVRRLGELTRDQRRDQPR